jgi:hypothetical protein
LSGADFYILFMRQLVSHISNYIAFPHILTGHVKATLGAEWRIKARGLQGI